jgi:hypothetical protein
MMRTGRFLKKKKFLLRQQSKFNFFSSYIYICSKRTKNLGHLVTLMNTFTSSSIIHYTRLLLDRFFFLLHIKNLRETIELNYKNEKKKIYISVSIIIFRFVNCMQS